MKKNRTSNFKSVILISKTLIDLVVKNIFHIFMKNSIFDICYFRKEFAKFLREEISLFILSEMM